MSQPAESGELNPETGKLPPLLVECRPQRVVAAIYEPLPFPAAGTFQDFAVDLGVTALAEDLLLAGLVIKGYRDHQLIFEQRWPHDVLRAHTGEEDLTIAAGTGLALRTLHFFLQGREQLTHLEFVALARDSAGERIEERVLAPVVYPERRTDFHLPVEGTWWVIQAADWSDLHKQEVVSQPFAVDFVRLGEDSQFFRGDGLALEDHFSWDQPVYAAAGGKVAYAQFDMPDLPPGQLPDPRIYRQDPRRLLGNAVAISHGNGEFSYYAHLQQATLAVREGEVVRRGALLGRVGNSGQSPGPHLHMHVMEGPNAFLDQGLPLRFSHFHAGGRFYSEPTFLPTRMIVRGEGFAQHTELSGAEPSDMGPTNG